MTEFAQTGIVQTGIAQTGIAQTGIAQTGIAQTGVAETGVAQICAQYGDDPAALLEILHDVQDALGHIPEVALPAIAKRLNISRAEAHGVMSFYHDFRRDPAQGVVVKICRAEACQAMGAEALWTRIAARQGLTVEPVYCLGNCALAPAAMVAGQLIGKADDARLTTAIAEAGA